MPIYEYRCSSCGHQQEFLQKVSDAPLTVCTAVRQAHVREDAHGRGLPVEGQRLVRDGFRNQGAAPQGRRGRSGEATSEIRGRSPKRSEAKPETKTETKTEAKSEAKSESKPAAPASPAQGVADDDHAAGATSSPASWCGSRSGITLWVLKLARRPHGPVAAAAARRASAREALFGFHVPGPGHHPHARDRARHRRARRQLLRPQAARARRLDRCRASRSCVRSTAA